MLIRAEGKFSTKDVWRGSVRHGWKPIAFATAFGVLVLAVAAFFSVSSEDGWRGQLVFFGLGLFLTVYIWVFLLYRAYRQVKLSPNLQGTVRFQFDDAGFVAEASHTRVENKWTGIVKWKEGKHCFLVYTNPSMANIIPKRFFQSPPDVDAVRELFRTHITRK